MSKTRRTLPYGEQITAGDSDSILASIYRAILFNGNVQAHNFEKMLVRYIQRVYREASNIRDRTSLKASLFKELMADRMTWRVFIKGLRAMNITQFEITIRAYAGNHIVETCKMVNLSDEEIILDNEGENN